jgi:hypothetical protein
MHHVVLLSSNRCDVCHVSRLATFLMEADVNTTLFKSARLELSTYGLTGNKNLFGSLRG